MKYQACFVLILILCSCNQQHQEQSASATEQEVRADQPEAIPLILPATLENRRTEFDGYLIAALENIRTFAIRCGWEELTVEPFMDSVMIFDNKHNFNIALLTLAGADTSMNLPDTYLAALENRTLMAMTPEYYAMIYPEGIEDQSYPKLLTHEIAHRLHIRILNGDEEAMGPVWFYEGFAIFAANQFVASELDLSKREMTDILNDPERGSYVRYNSIFRYFVSQIPLKELVEKAKMDTFNDEMIQLLK
jgi:hypothetical protein